MLNITYFNYLPSDIIKIIHNQLDFFSQSNLRLASKYFVENPITNLSHDSSRDRLKSSGNSPSMNELFNLTNVILKLYPFVTKLNIAHNEDVTDISHLVNLQILNASGYSCGINNNSLLSLTNLTELNTHNNSKITDVNHLIKLRTLNAVYNSGISDNGIRLLTNLTELDVYDNSRIRNINHLINLRILNIGRDCGIEDDGIKSLTNLTELNITRNNKITNISHLINLQKLNRCEINTRRIKHLTNITKLNYKMIRI